MRVSHLRRKEARRWCEEATASSQSAEREWVASCIQPSLLVPVFIVPITILYHWVRCSWGFSIKTPLPSPASLASAQLMHFLLFVCSAAKQEKTPDEILRAAIRIYCSRLHKRFLSWRRQKFNLDFLVNKRATASPLLEVQLKISFIAAFWCALMPPLCKPQQWGRKDRTWG